MEQAPVGDDGWEGAVDGIRVSQRLEQSLKTGPWFPWQWDPIWLTTCLLVLETGSLVVQTGLSFYAVEGGLELSRSLHLLSARIAGLLGLESTSVHARVSSAPTEPQLSPGDLSFLRLTCQFSYDKLPDASGP